MTALSVVTPAEGGAITLVEAKAHLRISDAYEDALIEGLILAATEAAEAITKRALCKQTWDYLLDHFCGCMTLPKAPLQSVENISYVDGKGDKQTVDPAVFTVDTASEPGRVYLAYSQSWPTTRRIPHAVTIRIVAGYDEIPSSIQAAVKLMVGHWFENREEATHLTVKQIPMGVKALLGPYSVDIL